MVMTRLALVCGVLACGTSVFAQNTLSAGPTIVFVCEHGTAKSVVATAYFNKLAAEKGLRARATFRSTNPQQDLSQTTLASLKTDGIKIPTGQPSTIAQKDIDAATHIFAIGCTLPKNAAASGKAADWSDVPDGQGYAAMRDAIRAHVEQLIAELQKR